MAVETKYVVVRKGEEKMSFASKKEADSWDKMLDLAESFEEWLEEGPVELDESQREALGLWLAEHKETLSTLIKTGKRPQPKAATAPEQEEKAAPKARAKHKAA
jgi:dsDNA-binding SOS-regulon protein